MTLEDIAIAFKDCNGNTSLPFKDFIQSKLILKQSFERDVTFGNCLNYILGDVEHLLDKSLINLCAADNLSRSGFFNWAFVTSYYANFFCVQAINRLHLNFYTYIHDTTLLCQVKNYVNQEITLTKRSKNSNSHERTFHQFYQNISLIKKEDSVDRFWNIGINKPKGGFETSTRNDINYSVDRQFYYELKMEEDKFQKIINDNSKYFNKPKLTITDPVNFAIKNSELGLSRIRVLVYLLNYIANSHLEYKSYFERNMKRRKENVKLRLLNNEFLLDILEGWLQFNKVELNNQVNLED